MWINICSRAYECLVLSFYVDPTSTIDSNSAKTVHVPLEIFDPYSK